MLAIVPVDGGMFRIVSLAYDGGGMYREVGWYTIESDSFVKDNARATLYRAADSAAARIAILDGKPRSVRCVPFIPTVTQHIDGYGLTAPRVWMRDMPT